LVDTFGALKKMDLEINPQAEQDKDAQSVLLRCRERAFSTLGLLSLNVDVQEKGSKRQPIYELSQSWEDFYDPLIARLRANELRESLESVKGRLRQRGEVTL